MFTPNQTFREVLTETGFVSFGSIMPTTESGRAAYHRGWGCQPCESPPKNECTRYPLPLYIRKTDTPPPLITGTICYCVKSPSDRPLVLKSQITPVTFMYETLIYSIYTDPLTSLL